MKQKTITYRKIVDLSHEITPDMPLWPGDPAVAFKTVATHKNDGYYLRCFSIGEHSATHMNAPKSFQTGGAGIEAYAPQSLVHPAVVIDVREQSHQNSDYVITPEDVLAWEKKHGGIETSAVVLFYTGWQALWHSPPKFFNADPQGGLHFPGIGGQTACFLLQERQIAGVGIDTHGVDPGRDAHYATNKQVLANNGIVLECLTNLHQLPPKGATLVIGLLKLHQGSGSPVSVLAFIP